jgi:hypothetical protein
MSTKWLAVMAVPFAIGVLATDAWSAAPTSKSGIARLPREARAAVARPRAPRTVRDVSIGYRVDEACNLPSSGCTNDKRDSN